MRPAVAERRRRRPGLGLLACLCLVAAAIPADAATSISTTTNSYDVSGATMEEVAASMAANRPWKTNAYRAKTDWQIGYKFHFGRTNGTFFLSRFDLQTRITVTLPRWTAPPEADAALRSAWAGFMRALLTHEAGHIQIGTKATKEVANCLSQLPGAASADELKAAVERAVDAVIDAHRKQEEEYDRVTRSGFTQGAVFPPVRGR